MSIESRSSQSDPSPRPGDGRGEGPSPYGRELFPVVCRALGRKMRSVPVVWLLRRDIPRAYRWLWGRFIAGVLLVWVGTRLLRVSPLGTIVDERQSVWLAMSAFGALFLIQWRAETRLRRQLVAADWRLCPRCLYDLSALPNESVCPECGAPFEHGTIRRMWQRCAIARGHHSGTRA